MNKERKKRGWKIKNSEENAIEKKKIEKNEKNEKIKSIEFKANVK